MKKIVVISDTHGNMAAIEQLEGIFEECDCIIHLGDTSGDGAKIAKKYPDKTFLLNGNSDFMHCGENEIALEIEKVKIFATHGHYYSVKNTLSKLAKHAKELRCQLALYGHTHSAGEDIVDGVKLVNPGTLSRYSKQSYAYIVLNAGKSVVKIVYLN